jgi:hypothetical protein
MRSSLTAVLLLVVIGTMVSVLAAPQQAQPQAPPTPAAMPPPLPTGPAPDLDFVFTAEVAGYVEPCG